MTRSREVSKGATRNEFIYTATATQTTFSGNDDSSNSLSYTAGQIDVFLNGSRLAPADFTATNGTSVVLGSGAVANDIVQINAFGSFSVADVIVARAEFDYTATAGQTTFTGSDNDSQTMAYTAGRIDVYLNGSRLNVTDDYVATNGTSVVLEAGAQAGDSLVVVSHGTVNLAANIVAGDLDLNGNELILDVDGDTTITADTDDQIDFKIGGSDIFQMTASKLDLNGKELVLDADGDTSITADTDDQIDVHIAGADDFKFTANTFHALDGSTVLIGGQSSDSVGGATCNLQLEGTSTADSSISLKCNTNGTTAPTIRFGKSRGTAVGSDTVVQDGDELGVLVFAGADGTDTETQGAVIIAAVDGTPGSNDLPTRLLFNTTADGASGTTERMRITQSGEVLIATTDGSPWNNTSAAGIALNAVGGGAGLVAAARVGGDPLAVNRVTNDGNVIAIYAQGNLEGSISVSGSTVSYNAFTGSHWSRLSDNSKPSILKGTVMETIDTMCEWYQLVFKTSDDVDKVVEIALPSGKSVGDSHTITHDGESVTGTIRKKDDDKHCMSKISDTEDSASVYGVFMDWNTETDYNDMYINALGTSLVRVASGVTVSKGDLLSSKGDGTAKLQGDDIIKTKTIGKVLSNVKQETYDDGSFTVPCALYCG